MPTHLFPLRPYGCCKLPRVAQISQRDAIVGARAPLHHDSQTVAIALVILAKRIVERLKHFGYPLPLPRESGFCG